MNTSKKTLNKPVASRVKFFARPLIVVSLIVVVALGVGFYANQGLLPSLWPQSVSTESELSGAVNHEQVADSGLSASTQNVPAVDSGTNTAASEQGTTVESNTDGDPDANVTDDSGLTASDGATVAEVGQNSDNVTNTLQDVDNR